MQFVFKYRYLFLFGTFAIAAGLFQFVGPAFKTNNSLEIWFLQNDPNLQAYYQAQEIFGNDEVIAIYFEPPEGLLTEKNLKRVRKLSDKLADLQYIDRVFSLTTAKEISNQNDSLVVDNLVPRDQLSTEQRKKIRQQLKNNRLFAGFLSNRDAKGVMITVQLEARKDIDELRGQINQSVINVVQQTLRPDNIRFHTGGTGIIGFSSVFEEPCVSSI